MLNTEIDFPVKSWLGSRGRQVWTALQEGKGRGEREMETHRGREMEREIREGGRDEHGSKKNQ